MGSSKRSTFVSDAAHHEGGRADGWQGAQGSAHGDFADRNDARQHLEASDHTVAVLAQATLDYARAPAAVGAMP